MTNLSTWVDAFERPAEGLMLGLVFVGKLLDGRESRLIFSFLVD
jgi:hypothetical protein